MRLYLAWVCVAALAAAAPVAANNPNIVLIVADDLGYGDLGCYGSDVHETPHIDRLAAEGLRFTDFHSNGSMCTPTRAAMLTGLYQQRFGRKFEGPISGQFNRDHGLPSKAVTIAEMLKELGYTTGMFGKWHLGYIPPWLPPDQGFDEFRGLGAGDGDHHSHIDRWGREDWWNNNELAMEEGYTADLLTKYSVDFIERHADESFFLYVPHLAIHFPWQGPDDPPHREKGVDYNDDKWGIIPEPANVAPHVKAMVESFDASVGAIVGALDEAGVSENTLVIVTSDNGGYLTYGETFQNISSNGALRGQKGTLWEGGHRVPMVFYWPDRIEAGVTGATAMSIDLVPTFLEMVLAPLPGKLDGLDLSPLLFEGAALPKRTLYWREGEDWAVRRGPWKLCAQGGPADLFHLGHDLAETTPINETYPEQVTALRAAWEAWSAEVGGN